MKELAIDCRLAATALESFLREELHSAGFQRAILGLSGGIDSALSALLAARALGPGNVTGVLMPYRTSNPDSEAHAMLVAKQLTIPTRRVDISAMADGYLHVASNADRTRRGNVLARCRMIVLYDLSVELGALVLGTSNKTELLLGYSTQYGDAACAVNPLGDLYKDQVVQLARFLELPKAVIDKAPSADLFPGQTDEGDLGFTYAQVDQLLYYMIDERCGEEELTERGFDPAFVRKIATRVAAMQYKRVPPLIAKLSRRTINQDFRYLRDWGR